MRRVMLFALLVGISLGGLAGCSNEKGEPVKKTVKDNVFRNRFGDGGGGVPIPATSKR